jgi:Protein of unknown function (DUF2568)
MMSNHPINHIVRFLLELFILFAIGYWAWHTHEGVLRYFLVVALPLATALAWGIFRVPADHGKGLVAVPGIIRLLLELIVFAAAWWCLQDAGLPQWALGFLIISLIHYAISYDRIVLLLKN